MERDSIITDVELIELLARVKKMRAETKQLLAQAAREIDRSRTAIDFYRRVSEQDRQSRN